MESTIEKIRQYVMEYYDMDINEATRHFSTFNYAFISPNNSYMIRVNAVNHKTKEEYLSEVLWLDDLKAFNEHVCSPEPSKRNNLLETFEIDGVVHRATMFRTAKGTMKLTNKLQRYIL